MRVLCTLLVLCWLVVLATHVGVSDYPQATAAVVSGVNQVAQAVGSPFGLDSPSPASYHRVTLPIVAGVPLLLLAIIFRQQRRLNQVRRELQATIAWIQDDQAKLRYFESKGADMAENIRTMLVSANFSSKLDAIEKGLKANRGRLNDAAPKAVDLRQQTMQQLQGLSDQMEDLERELRGVKDGDSNVVAQVGAQEARLEDVESQLDEIEAALDNNPKGKFEEMKGSLDDYRKRVKVLTEVQEGVVELSGEIDPIVKTTDALDAKEGGLNANFDKVQETLEGVEEKIKGMEEDDEGETAQDALTRLKNQKGELEERLEALEETAGEVTDLAGEVSDLAKRLPSTNGAVAASH